MARTPKRRELKPSIPGARFLTDVVGENVRDLRVLRRLSQGDVAARMKQLGHETWSGVAVSDSETGKRRVSIDELLGLALVLGAEIADLLDPRSIDGRATAPIDYGAKEYGLPVDIVGPWVRGEIVLQLPAGPTSVAIALVPGYEDELEEARAVLERWNSERQHAVNEARAAMLEREQKDSA